MASAGGDPSSAGGNGLGWVVNFGSRHRWRELYSRRSGRRIVTLHWLGRSRDRQARRSGRGRPSTACGERGHGDTRANRSCVGLGGSEPDGQGTKRTGEELDHRGLAILPTFSAI